MKPTKHILLLAALLLGSLTASAHDFESGGIYYNITDYSDLTVEVTYRGDSPDEYSDEYLDMVTIPSTVSYKGDTYRVTSIGWNAFSGCITLTAINIPEGVTYIGEYAFYECSSLTAINIPEGVTSIGGCAFFGCSSLTAINIPDGVTSIGSDAFNGCSSLTSITIPESVTSIGSEAFSGCSSLTAINIPEGVTYIGWNAFSGCSSLASITIPESVTSIGSSTFYGCSSLASITIPESVTSIEGYAFNGCSSLTDINIPEGVTSIGYSAFNGCSSLTAVHISSLEAWCNIDLSDLYANPLHYAKNLYINGELVTELAIPNSVTAIKDYAFSVCSSLTAITIPEGVTSIGNYAFYGCSNLTAITIPENSQLTSIGECAFIFCSSLTSITIPEGVTSIEDGAFSGCWSLTDMRVNIASIESWLNNNFSSSLGVSYSLYLDGELLSSVEIPSSVTSIPNHAFYKCNSIISVIIPEGVTMIGENAFQNCSALTIAVLPKSLSMIKKNAFYGCYNLGSIIIPENVEFIYQEAFAACWALESIKVLATEPPFAYDNTFSNYDIELCVPEEAMETYRTTAPWSKFTSIRNLEGEEVEVKQCAAPVISYVDGQVVLTCETEGVTFKSSITANDARSYDEATYALTGIYTITAQATKEGYLDSETVTATLCWVPCDENHDSEETDIITIPAKPVLIQTDGGTITVNGLAEGTVVKVNDLNGAELGTATATGGTATITTCLTAGNVAIVKIGERSVKVAIK